MFCVVVVFNVDNESVAIVHGSKRNADQYRCSLWHLKSGALIDTEFTPDMQVGEEVKNGKVSVTWK